ncbi:zeta toxin family protein [Xanthomonas campestris]|uniref:zeta toxin family protein n=1 Tax=Xanthomonas campestris TaxID=339 RepID=UPI0023687BC8|nr:zeta toxin family protein [Xanthomonas campestris]
MPSLERALAQVLQAQRSLEKPFAIVLAGHNGSGKSTMWYRHLVQHLRVPLINADRMMMSILPELTLEQSSLPDWARQLRDTDENWMCVAQSGVQAFVAHAMAASVPFAMETVFSHWKEHADGRVESKIDLIRDLQASNYFVLLIFVGLSNSALSIARVSTRVAQGGHAVDTERLLQRFSRTQKAVHAATKVADATILADNSQGIEQAFSVCRIQLADQEIYDCRRGSPGPPAAVLQWLEIVSPPD